MKTYADECLERAEKATEGPWKSGVTYHHEQNAKFIAHARTDVPELARRLKKACETIRELAGCLEWLNGWSKNLGTDPFVINLFKFADELEAMPEEK